jgi:hypothetical protein
MVLLWVLLRRHLDSLHLVEVAGSALRTLLAVAAATGAGLAAAAALAPLLSGNWIARLAPGLGATAAFCLTFLLAAWLVKSQELATIAWPVMHRLRATLGR